MSRTEKLLQDQIQTRRRLMDAIDRETTLYRMTGSRHAQERLREFWETLYQVQREMDAIHEVLEGPYTPSGRLQPLGKTRGS